MKQQKKMLVTLLGAALSFASYGQRSAKDLPPATSQKDPIPTAPQPNTPKGGVTEQAGVGGTQAYARSGVLELGGSGGFTLTSKLKEIDLSPSVGWFFMDNWQISAIMNYAFAQVKDVGHAQTLSFLLEPSFHLPMNNQWFAFLGLGAGLNYTDTPSNLGLAIAPRIGTKVLVGRSGLLNLFIRTQFTTNNYIQTPRGTLVALDSSTSLGIGYSVMW